MKIPIQVQVQVQSNEENQVRHQTILKQKEGMYVPQTRQNTNKCIKQNLENDTAPKYIHRP